MIAAPTRVTHARIATTLTAEHIAHALVATLRYTSPQVGQGERGSRWRSQGTIGTSRPWLSSQQRSTWRVTCLVALGVCASSVASGAIVNDARHVGMYDYGYCIEPGCGERFVRKSDTHKKCEAHGYIAKSMQRVVLKEKKCPHCLRRFQTAKKEKIYCSSQCRDRARSRNQGKGLSKSASEIKRGNCVKCGVQFFVDFESQDRCSACFRSARVANTTPTILDNDLPCHKCVHSKPNRDATFGVECTIGWWLRCKPLRLGAKPKEVRIEKMDASAEAS